MPGTASALERHEWWKHGTCSGLQGDEYFALAILLIRQTERGKLAHLIVAQAGKTVARSKLLAAFAADFGPDAARAVLLDCAKAQGESTLLEIHIRLKRDRISEGLNPDTLAIPQASPRGSCPVDVRILNWKK
jgi:ribonuclease T2